MDVFHAVVDAQHGGNARRRSEWGVASDDVEEKKNRRLGKAAKEEKKKTKSKISKRAKPVPQIAFFDMFGLGLFLLMQNREVLYLYLGCLST